MTDDKRKPGRPALPATEARTARVELRVTQETKATWQAKAAEAGMSLQAWLDRCAASSAGE